MNNFIKFVKGLYKAVEEEEKVLLSMTIDMDIMKGAEMLMCLKKPYMECFKTGAGKFMVVNSQEEKTYKVFKFQHTSTGTIQVPFLDLCRYETIYRFKDPIGHNGVLIHNGGNDYLLVCRAILSFKLNDFPDLSKCKTYITDGNLLISNDEIYLEFTHTGRFRVSVWNCVGEQDILREHLTFRLISL